MSVKIKSNDKACYNCKKRSKILFDCRCGFYFCSNHRLAFDHQCTYDYKKIAQEKIKRENPIIITDKIKDRL